MSDEEIQDIVLAANLTPRKCLGFKTQFQAILRELGKDVQIRFPETRCPSLQNSTDTLIIKALANYFSSEELRFL